jgi:hypothetical protein
LVLVVLVAQVLVLLEVRVEQVILELTFMRMVAQALPHKALPVVVRQVLAVLLALLTNIQLAVAGLI